MKFARLVFVGAGIWGLVVLTPLFWLVDVTGRAYAPPSDYPQFFYGFVLGILFVVAFVKSAPQSRDRG